MTAILEGIRVLDFSQVYSAPLCGQMLGDLGAEVIKIEAPPSGGANRRSSYPWVGGQSSIILECNRNKKSIGINLKTPEGKEVVYRLVANSDVVIQNFRPGVMERLGVSYEDLINYNPKIVYASISGFGDTGPYSQRKGQDLVAQAMSGAFYINTFDGKPPLPIANCVADHGAGRMMAFGIMSALFARERHGEGQKLSVSLLDAMIELQLEPAFFYLNSGEQFRRGPYGRGNAPGSGVPYGVYQTKDERWISYSSTLSEICQAFGIEDLGQDPRYDTAVKQKANRELLWQYVEDAFAKLTYAEAVEALDKADVQYAPVYDYEQAFSDPQVLHNEMVIEVENPAGGTYKTTGSSVKYSKMPAKPQFGPPRFAQHTDEVLTIAGYSPEEIEELAKTKVVSREK